MKTIHVQIIQWDDGTFGLRYDDGIYVMDDKPGIFFQVKTWKLRHSAVRFANKHGWIIVSAQQHMQPTAFGGG